MMDWKKIVAGAVSGLVAAAMVDLDAWRAGKDPDADGLPGFDVKKALRRYAYGAFSGALTAIGFGAVVPNGA